MYPKVYIILLNYNGWADTVECLESVLRNDYPNYQVIVVDNNSPNNSIEYIKAWAEGKLNVWVKPDHSLRHLSFPPVRKPIPYVYYTREEAERGGNRDLENILKLKLLNAKKGTNGIFNQSSIQSVNYSTQYPLILIQTGENLGFAGGNNVGIIYALAKDDVEYIWLLNNDTVIERNSLFEMVKIIQSKKQIGIIGSKLLRYDRPNILQSLCGAVKITWSNAGEAKYIYPNEEDCPRFEEDFEIEDGYIIGASMLIRKEVFKETGLFDEAFFMWAEETDLCMRAIKKGWKLYCCGKSKVWHKEGSSTGKGETKKFLWRTSERSTLMRFFITGYLDIRNHIYFVKKHWGKFYMWAYILGPNTIKLTRRIIGILMYDDNKLKRINLLLKGLLDGINGKMGKPEGLIK